MSRSICCALLAAVTAIATTASGQTEAGTQPAATESEPPWPPPPIDDTSARLIDQLNTQAASQPASAPAAPPAPTYTQPLPDAPRPQPQPAPQAAPPGYPPPRYPPGYMPPRTPPSSPVPDAVRHARAFGIVGAQIPLSVAWSSAAAATALLATSFLLATPALPLLPFGLAIAATPLAVSLTGSALSSLATVGVLPLVDLIFSAPPAPEDALLTTALIAGAYAALIGIVAGVPLTIPALFAAAHVSVNSDASTVLTYALVAALIPLAAAPMAQLEAANEGGYQADLPLWCWYAMQICSIGTYYIW